MIFLSLEELMGAHLATRDRRHFIGGSDARIIMGSDEDALLRLWREKRGEAEPEDLSNNFIVQMGVVTEPLNRAWYVRRLEAILSKSMRAAMRFCDGRLALGP